MKPCVFQILFLVFFIFVSPESFAQYNYDVGLRVSSFNQERYLLEQRFHLESPYTIVGTIGYGFENVTISNDPITHGEFTSDTTVEVGSFQQHESNFYTLKVGVQRKLNFFESDVFYAGATLSSTLENQNYQDVTTYYHWIDTLTSVVPPDYDGFSVDTETSLIRTLHSQVALTFGMDVPITKRLLVNVEVGLAAILSSQLNSTYHYMQYVPSFSGGFRYRFGKRE